ncbi:hypothetical protein AGMMS50267_10510 [Spirochaetia bacterium]|nr:hypothetical protein AGMMS50267_10450 [Spirochaetia bacterium]GHV88691.1 hypothetical protein AGMMS50267_10510 [Spirochaetia bacterium]
MNRSKRMYDFHTQLLIDDLIEGLARKIDTRAVDILDIKNPNVRCEKWKAVINDAMCSSAETGYVDGVKGADKF